MSFTLVAYDLLKTSIKESIVTEIKSKGLDPLKLEESIEKLPDDRRIQARLLLKTIALLDAVNPKTEEARRIQARILNAITFYIRDQIKVIYETTFPYVSPERSTLYNHLTASLDLNTNNYPDTADLVDMYGSLRKFLLMHVYKSAKPKKGYLEEQPFDIKGYSVESDIITLSTKVHTWGMEVIQRAKERHLEELEAKKPVVVSRGYLGFGSIFGSSSVEPVKKDCVIAGPTIDRL
ncbi:hypothetical protein TUM19329_25560 [Legionella antarctica]|uniref:Dot/Icm T4SS effector n=1 Tax=Legionella antarctica TaxID=2708020 RepID=A0A6F8T675_9GAMM|nr:hypothetical protein [Legionella antarctica]BCA96195.1 hypothetical protein TUM19329_25560 [Legionella antarctica]